MAMEFMVALIQRRVAEHFGITMDEMLGRRLERRVSRPRMVAYLLAHELTPYSFPRIAAAFGRERTSVVYGIVSLERQMELHPDLATEVEACRAELRRTMGMNRVSC